jgi:hypothetical protein
MIAAIHLFASVVLGLLLWNWMQAGEGSLEGSVPGDVTVARLPQRGAV